MLFPAVKYDLGLQTDGPLQSLKAGNREDAIFRLVPAARSAACIWVQPCSDRLFRGRDDVYAGRWEEKNGRTGYSPAPICEYER